ncbi:helix-turn-helix transcriptional regulator [Staphylococcus sp. GDY8P48P]|uniref:helix-turn-helix domain-containing protein n=1 Tax=Staphylococcus sp. GDY8P48P TaxID=2804122 RepID=UPI001AEC6421|nr:helix-turn-helix transcriptional regulator [Staphylococcus sp. GDY8P48P]
MTYIKYMRTKLKLNISEMAMNTGIPLTTYQRMEAGVVDLNDQKYKQVKALADFFDITVDELIYKSKHFNKEGVQ